MGKRKRKISVKKLPLQRPLELSHEGAYFDLKSLFDKVNAEYFDHALRGYAITWGRRRRHPPKEYFVFGTIQEEDRVIRIHPLLDAPFVPTWFLEYVIYHEMLHAVVPEEVDEKGRRKVHTDEFYRRERQFHCFQRARRWEDENLDRFFRWRMRADDGVVLVYVTFPDPASAEHSVRQAVGERLAACGNLLPGVISIYRWKGAIETADEVLVLFKTTESKVESLRAAVLAAHPYEVPEFVITPLTGGNPEYLDWVRDCVAWDERAERFSMAIARHLFRHGTW